MGIFNSVKNTGYASRVADIPKTAHFVILQDSSVYACDDDGSNGSNYPILSYKWYIFVEDWEAVSHAFRAAYQVKHILLDGGYTYPLPETYFIKLVKSGTLSFMNEVGPKLEELMEELEVLSAKSTLPRHTDRKFWDNWLLEILSKEM